jgi:lipoprotein Spr
MIVSALAVAKTSLAQTPSTNSLPVAPVQEQSLMDRIIEKSTDVLSTTTKSISSITEKYSKMMQVSPASLSNVVLYEFIDEWYGTKYRFGGTNKAGIDCSSLVQKLYKYVYGMDLLRTSILQFRSSTYISERASLKEGDLIFFRIAYGPVSHVGVYLGNNYFVHASSSKGVMISNLNESYWRSHYVGGGRMKN